MGNDLFRQTQLRQIFTDARQRGLLDDAACDRAFILIGPPAPWWQGLDRVVLALGVALVLSGIVFFFAYNWQAMTPFLKFAVLQVAILACLAGGAVKGFHSLVGRYLLLAAALVLGVLLAVFGQVYQTGADNYLLFGVWAVLILPWALMVPFKPLRLMWVILANLGLLLFLKEAGPQLMRNGLAEQCMAMTALNLLLFALTELKLLAEMPRLPLWIASLAYASVPVFFWIGNVDAAGQAYQLAFAFWLVLMLAGAFVFYKMRPDFHPLALVTLNTVFMALTWLVQLNRHGQAGAMLLNSLLIAIAASATFAGLLRLRKYMEDGNE